MCLVSLSPSRRRWTAGVREQETDSGLGKLKSRVDVHKLAGYAAPAREQFIIAEIKFAKAW